MKRLTLLCLITALAPLAAPADDAPTAPAAPVDSLAPHTCVKPNIEGTKMTKDLGTHDQRAVFEAYQQCIKEYVTNQQKLQQLHFQAGSAALKEFNDFVPVWNDYQNQPQH
jgi:hypothetical protein